MKVGISTASLTRFETEDALKKLKELGAETAEVYLKTFYEYRPEFAKKVAPLADGVEVHSVHVNPQNFEPQLFSPSRRVRGDGFYWLDQIMRSAQLFGAKNYTFNGFIDGGDDFDLSEVFNFCARYGVNLCIENASLGLYNRPFKFKALKNRCQGLSGVFDLQQAINSGYPYQMYIKDMEGSISLVRLPLGQYDFKEVLTRLKDAGFDGAVIIDNPAFDGVEQLTRSVEFLKEIAYKT